MESVGHRNVASEQLQRTGLGRVNVLVALLEHPVPRDQQESGKKVQDPAGTGDDGRSGSNKQAPEDQRPQDAQEEDAVLVLARNRKKREDDRPDKNVVHGQGLFNQIPGEVLLPELGAVQEPDHTAERHAEEHPHSGPHCGFTDRDNVRVPVGDEVHDEHDEDESDDSEPHPQGDIHGAPASSQ
ncbi:hypothetical protein ARTHROSP310_15710 [Arthrobacter sp. AD-310]